MLAEGLLALVRINLVMSLALAFILLVRAPARRLFGAHAAYALWAMIPLAALGAVMPLDMAGPPDGPIGAATLGARAWLSGGHRSVWLLMLWLAGALASAALTGARQSRFMKAERSGRAGPAAVGVVTPRLVTPANFADRFPPAEWRLIRAHERAHIDRLDGRRLAAAIAIQCLCWFNPLGPLALSAFRLDQELACDATVMERLPGERRRYAETLLRVQPDPFPSPLGANFRRGAALETRLAMLSQRPPSLDREELGFELLALVWLGAFLAAWASEPPWRTPSQPPSMIAARGEMIEAPSAPALDLPGMRLHSADR